MKKTSSNPSVTKELWEQLTESQRERLRRIAAILVSCEACAEKVLLRMRAETSAAHVTTGFACSFAMREVVRQSIQHCQQPQDPCGQPGSTQCSDMPLSSLPWPERIAYIAREVLHYSRRDAALLLGMSDAQADKLLGLALRRGAAFEPVSRAVEDAAPEPESQDSPLKRSADVRKFLRTESPFHWMSHAV